MDLSIPPEIRRLLALPNTFEAGSHSVLPIDNGHGACVSFFSPDRLDEAAFAYAGKLANNTANVSALDIGSSQYIPQSIRFARLGLSVMAFDIAPTSASLTEINNLLPGSISYHCDAVSPRVLLKAIADRQVNVVYSTRFLSHLPFGKAKSLLYSITRSLYDGAYFFLSFASLDSSLSEGYSKADAPIFSRFAVPNNDRAEGSGLRVPICLYKPSEVRDLLLAPLPIHIHEMFESKLGTIKIIAEVKH